MKKRIMFLLYNMNVGGTEKALLNMLEVMDQNMFDVDVYLLKKTGGFLNDIPKWVNVKVIEDYSNIESWVMDPPLLVVKKLLKLKKIIISLQLLLTHIVFKMTDDRSLYYNTVTHYMNTISDCYDCAIAYAGPMDFITKYILNNVNAREKIQWIHFDVSQFHFNVKFSKKNYPNFNKVVVCSKSSAKSLKSILPNIINIIEVVPNFVSKSKCYNESKLYLPYSQEELDNKKIILTVGRLTKEKGQDIIPNVTKKLLELGFNNFIWYIVGDGNNYSKIKKDIEKDNLTKYIKMVGLQQNPYPYYANCDLYVQTSIHEGYCITIAEALVFNKYIISTDVAGAYDQIDNDDIGMIVNRDVNSICREIALFLEKGDNAYEN